jgi:predicted GH43/DUF377 family glycosyl hydrolase
MSDLLLPPSETAARGLGVYHYGTETYVYYCLGGDQRADFQVLSAQEGAAIQTFHEDPWIKDRNDKRIPVKNTSNFRCSILGNVFALTYLEWNNNQRRLHLALSKNLVHWKQVAQITEIANTAIIIPNYYENNQFVMFFGDHDIRMATSANILQWNVRVDPILPATKDQWGTLSHIVGTAIPMDQGIALLYFARGFGGNHWSIHAVVLDKKNPASILWKADTIWEHHEGWEGKNVQPLGMIHTGKELFSYWNFEGEGVYAITHSAFSAIMNKKLSFSHMMLQRSDKNPVVKPGANFWESKQTFNAAAVYDRDRVHLVYRAIGDTDTSVLGYASSADGFHFDDHPNEPVYVPTQPFELPVSMPNWSSAVASIKSPFESGGGGYGGCEDPRLTKIDDKYYLTYVAYDGANPPRIALSSISVEDFHAKNWNWKTPVLISPPGVVDKNCVIFPEKIRGKYAIMHRIYPNILLDYVDHLDFDGETFLKGEYRIRPSRTLWDTRKVGAGAPPLKTPFGWLLIYHAVGEHDGGKYKVGAMLLDLLDPTKVIARSIIPILEPNHPHDNEGFKAGVVYPCGAIIKGDQLIVYYGGADTVVCAASTNLYDFLEELLQTGSTRIKHIYKPKGVPVYDQLQEIQR